MELVQGHMNSKSFAADGGRGLEGLAKELLGRARELVKRRGERLPK